MRSQGYLVLSGSVLGVLVGGVLPIRPDKLGSEAAAIPGVVCARSSSRQVSVRAERIADADRAVTLKIRAADQFAQRGKFKLKYAVQIVDEAGRDQIPPVIAKTQEVDDGGEIDFDVVSPRLPDGFYKCIVYVVANKADTPADAHMTYHWEVRAGRHVSLTEEEWFLSAPNALRAVAL
jgi:hypothetical protein